MDSLGNYVACYLKLRVTKDIKCNLFKTIRSTVISVFRQGGDCLVACWPPGSAYLLEAYVPVQGRLCSTFVTTLTDYSFHSHVFPSISLRHFSACRNTVNVPYVELHGQCQLNGQIGMQRCQSSWVLPYTYEPCLVYECGKYLDLSKCVCSKWIIFLTVSVGQNLYMKIVGKLDTQFGSYSDVANNLYTLLIQQIWAIKIM